MSVLEAENIELKAKVKELESKLERFGELNETLSGNGVHAAMNAQAPIGQQVVDQLHLEHMRVTSIPYRSTNILQWRTTGKKLIKINCANISSP